MASILLELQNKQWLAHCHREVAVDYAYSNLAPA